MASSRVTWPNLGDVPLSVSAGIVPVTVYVPPPSSTTVTGTVPVYESCVIVAGDTGADAKFVAVAVKG